MASIKNRVILNAVLERNSWYERSLLFVYANLTKIFNSPLKDAPIIDVFEKNPIYGSQVYQKVKDNPRHFRDTIFSVEKQKAALSDWDNYLKHIKTIAKQIDPAEQIIITGHSSKSMSDHLVSEYGKEVSVEHIINILKEVKESRAEKGLPEKPFNISLMSCSGINIGRNLITKMQEEGLYGVVTARNHTVYPDPITGKKYNMPVEGGPKQNKQGDYKRVLESSSTGCREYKVDERGKRQPLSLESTPKANLDAYMALGEKLSMLEKGHYQSQELLKTNRVMKLLNICLNNLTPK
ncbi:MAG: hypothetical protein H0U57_08805 [Tatlockia sp.]|nr:hypothetical protein [Tatlockia sp.]